MTKRIPLEDDWTDVLKKARRGMALDDGTHSEAELGLRSGLSSGEIAALENGTLDEEKLPALAATLGLDAEKLLRLAKAKFHPGNIPLPAGLEMFSTPWSDFEVHSYLLWDPLPASTPVPAAAFDTGSDATEMLESVKQRGLALDLLLLTHGHGDHVFDLDRIVEKTGASAWIGEGEGIDGAHPFSAGKTFYVGTLRIETRPTWGHAKGGITYVVHGLEKPVAIVGDAIFSGSMGGANHSYKACLETNLREILSLPPETILCPGHGPLTTVALELGNNPFFAGSF